MSCRVIGVGGYLPGRPVYNSELEYLDTSDEWIVSRTGIKQRYFADISALEMAHFASKEALDHAGISAESVDLTIATTSTPDFAFPSIASSLNGLLGIKNSPSFDLNAVCSGFVYGLHMAHSLISTGQYKRILLTSTEKMSSLLSMKDRSVDVLFGDGAGSVIIEKSEGSVFDSTIGSDGDLSNILKTEFYEDSRTEPAQKISPKISQKISMEGREVYKYAVHKMLQCSVDLLERNNLSINDIDFFIPHQANARIIESVGAKINLPQEKLVLTVPDYANTSSSTIPLALNSLKQKNQFSNKIILASAAGAGMTYGGAIFTTR